MAIDVPMTSSPAEQEQHRPPDDDDDENDDGIDGATTPATAEAYSAASSRRVGVIVNRRRRHLPVIGLFVFYVCHDALQERMFRFEGYEYGFFMTLAEVSVMLVMSVVADEGGGISGMRLLRATTTLFARRGARHGRRRNRRKGGGGLGGGDTTTTTTTGNLSIPVLVRIGCVGVLLALAHGLGNASLNYSPYPLKVAFKSCKLVPTMALGACVTGRRHTGM